MFKRFINIGVTSDLNAHQIRETRVLNITAIILFVGLLIGATNVFFIGALYPLVFSICVATGTVFILVFNSKHYYNAALYCFIITLILTLIYASNYYPRSVGTMVYFFPVVFCVALIHNPNKPKYHLPLQFGLIFAGFFISQFKQLPFIQQGDFKPEQLNILRYYNLYFSILVTIVMVFLVIRQSINQYKDLNSLIHKLKDNQTLLSSSLKEKEILLAEVQHRVKNNLSVIIGLFNFQSELSENSETKLALKEAKDRVLSIAMVHDQLHAKDNLDEINLNTYISELVQELMQSYPVFSHAEIHKKMEDVTLDISKSIPVGLIVNEAVTNSFKHGFNDRKKPIFNFELSTSNGIAHLVINDNGIGFPPKDKINKHSLGLSLIESLAEQIDGKATFSNKDGARVEISFPLV